MLTIDSIKKIAIIGVGFMGGSFVLAVKEKFPNIEIVGYARNKKSYTMLKKLNILENIKLDLKYVVSDADVVVLALPIYVTIEYLKKISKFLKKEAIVIDLGSTKELIENYADKYLGKNINFVGCHPLCGSEKSSAKFSNKNLYKNSLCFITSSPKKSATKIIKTLWEKLGSRVIFISPPLHDRVLSLLSHLPHIISFSLLNLIPKKYLKFAPQSLKDMSRISASSASIWTDIFLSNKKNIIKDIKLYINILERFQFLIEKDDYRTLLNLLTKINAKYNLL